MVFKFECVCVRISQAISVCIDHDNVDNGAGKLLDDRSLNNFSEVIT